MLNLSSLNPEQREAVETCDGPVLILAGAGTGKTRVITYRIAHLIERGVAPEHILGVTFTNKAAREMQGRVRALLPRKSAGRSQEPKARQSAAESYRPAQPTICTFHSLCVRILRQHIEKLGYKRNFVIYDESEQLSAVKKVLAHISDKGPKVDPVAVLSLLSRFKNNGEHAGLFEQESVRVRAQEVRARYESALRACNAVDFDDLILLTLRVFREHPEALEACRAKYRYVMVDEYQDTNGAQFELVHALTAQHRNLCVVGDDDQSIYGWRGARISNLLDMEKYFPEVKVIKLEQNYRSTNTILNAANALIKHNVRRRAKRLWSQKGQGPKITLQSFANDDEEARTIVHQVDYARLRRRAPWSAHAILFRTNAQSRPLETALRQARVRYHLVGGQSFFDRREIRDFLAYLKVFVNPNDDISLLRVANVPARGLSDSTMEELLSASHKHKCSVFAAMKKASVTAALNPRARESLGRFVAFIDRTRAPLLSTTPGAAPHALQTWAERWLEEIGYRDELRRSEKEPEAADNRMVNLRELIGTLDGPGSTGLPTAEQLERFLEELTLDNEREEEKETDGDAVTLITMHSCKGLEFPHVFIVGLEEGLLPHARSKEERNSDVDEERRLFYVAVTRAMQTLSISYCRERKKFGEAVPCHPSTFLRELPDELVESADEQASKPLTVSAAKDHFAVLREVVG